MTQWGGGYVTDVEYMVGFFKAQAPAHLAVACLMGGVECDVFDRFETLSYLELGCGMGYGAMVLAASNPGWRVTAVDFNPAHIAAARSFAAEAGLDNITFIEADLSTLAEDRLAEDIPPADVVSLHGLWSWVPQVVREGVVRLLAAKVRSGGLVHLSYNALPAWQSALGMQRLVREAGLRSGAARSDRQVEAGFKVVKALNDAEAAHIRNFPFVQSLIERLGVAPTEYLAHEFMNATWSPCFHADVVEALGRAKLEYVAAAELIENFPDLTFTEPQRAVADQFDDPVMRELVKDMCLPRGLRHDVFVRGARRIDRFKRNAALSKVSLALVVPPEKFQYEADMPAGRAEFGREFYGAVVAALATGVKTVGELLELPGRTSRTDNPAELIAIMVGSDQAAIVVRPGAPVDATAMRFNAVTARRLVRVDRIGQGAGMASVRLGTGLRCPLLDLYVLDRYVVGGKTLPDPATLARDLGNVLAPEEQEKLAKAISHSLSERRTIWQTAGAI